MKNCFLLLGILLLPLFAASQMDVKEPYAADWKLADSLLNNGLPESAGKIADAIYSKAKQNNRQVQMMKAQLYLLNANMQHDEDALRNAIVRSEEQSATTSFPYNSVWQSITAQLYWNYYQQNRYKIMGRTKISAETKIADFEQWDAARFFQKISTLYLTSLKKSTELKQVNIEKYDPVLDKGVNARNLRPTLFDLLSFRALEYFENNEKDVTNPAFAFTMNDPVAFLPARDFVTHHFQSQDSLSLQWHALMLYQQLLALHMNDTSKDAFIDADLQRLEFAYNQSVLPDKKKLYKKALENEDRQYGNNPLSALASLKIVQLMMDQPVQNRRIYDPRRQSTAINEIDYVAARSKLERIIAKYPDSEGGMLSKQMLESILVKQLSLTAEEVVLPGEPSRVLVDYRNVKDVWIRVVKINATDNGWPARYSDNTEAFRKELTALKPIQEMYLSLPGTEDYDRHNTEAKIGALINGIYAVILSSDQSFEFSNNIISYALFQVSGISVISQNNGQGFVLDRKTGMPLKDALLDFYNQRYNGRAQRYDMIKAESASSDNEGRFKYSGGKDHYYNALKVNYESDGLFLNDGFSNYPAGEGQASSLQTFFFTDRSIYRPGQTIWFKGLMMRKEDRGRKNTVVAGTETSVDFYDVNNQKIATKKFTTNEFGSFSGSFTAPEGMLNGNMRITNKSGQADFSVEEYKRPKFSVTFDTVKKAFALNELVNVQGKAIAYAGNNIDNATVKYRVVRNTRWPYWWYAYRWGFPQSPEIAIAQGTVQTDKDGRFVISFKSIPDLAVAPESLPVFSYTVNADVTDINGETRSGSQKVSVGYTTLQLSINIPDQARPEDLDTMNISSLNLNDQFVETDMHISISKLKTPERVLRKRLWPVPDQFIIDSLSFLNDFPRDVYKNEDDHMVWPKQTTIFDKDIKTSKSGMIMVSSDIWRENGWYLVEITASDRNNKKLTEKKYVQVWSPKNSGSTNDVLVVLPQSQQIHPGDKAKIYTLSGYSRLHLLRQVTEMNNKPAMSQLDFSGDPVIWERQITDSDRGGISVTYLTVKENRVYTQQAYVNVPWDNKDLSISWETHRDKLQPGTKEIWTMVVKGTKKDKLTAEMVATLYDASLDAFRPHDWNIYGLFPSLSSSVNWNTNAGFGTSNAQIFSGIGGKDISSYEKSYDKIRLPGLLNTYRYRGGRVLYNASGTMAMEAAPAMKDASAKEPSLSIADKNQPGSANTITAEKIEVGKTEDSQPEINARKNLRETAFFLPQLKTDSEGNIRIEFTMPEALTEWKLMAFAHTKDMSTGILKGTVKTQKDLMVIPNLPRFLRQGDDIIISAKISNLSDRDLSGMARLELINARTRKHINLPFRLKVDTSRFAVAKGQSTTASWLLHVPESVYDPVLVNIVAQSGSFADGEENTLPVVTNRMLVTETLPLWINGNGTKTFDFEKLKHSDSSETLANHALTLEYTGNPAWYAVQALPYLMEYPYECAEQTFNRYYATALAAYIVNKSPRIKAVFDKWNTPDFSSLKSPLEENQELKSALLEETPWVLEAENETEQKRRIALLFEVNKLARTLDANMRKLKDMQLEDGSFPWFKGMYADRYITQYILTGLARLDKLGVKDTKGNMQQIISKALVYLDREMKKSYDALVKNKINLDDRNIDYSEVQYLYMRSFFDQKPDAMYRTAYDYYRAQSAKYWPKFNAYMKGMIALSLNRSGDLKIPKTIIQSLKETSIRKEELGMYWVDRGFGYWWYEAPVETQSLLIECFEEVADDNASVDAMKIWLLKQKQTQNWETTKATADACYALLRSGIDWLTNIPTVVVELGQQVINTTDQKQEVGSGYFKVRYEGKEISPRMSNVKLTVSDNPGNTSWGAVYWQYFENMDKITTAKTPLEIRKQLFIERNTDRGRELQPLTAGDGLKVGDKVKIRIEIIVDRDMEYVQLKDMRASCFEPVNVISGYSWQGGLGYYQSTKDISTNFFFDHLNRGKYVFEYPVFVSSKGDFSNGIATIQCMYAPEFSSHSEGIRVNVN